MAERKASKRELLPTDFEADLKIDTDRLDDALVNQPEIFYRISDALSLAISKRDQIKLDLERELADAASVARVKLEKKMDKVTEKAVAQEVESDKVVVKLRDELVSANREVGQWGALKDAYDQRNKALKALVELYCANYFTKASAGSARNMSTDNDADRNRNEAGSSRRSRMKE